jgi:SAM-dependent methyltransferase
MPCPGAEGAHAIIQLVMPADPFSSVLSRVQEFKATILAAKRDIGDQDFEWYPYDTFTAFTHLNALLTDVNRSLFSGNQKILDVGCQDGELSFFLESLGHEVVALDHPTYNHNGMRGVRALKQALNSGIRILEVDLDRHFILPDDKYDLAVVLGVLYHLRNPFYVLEQLAMHAHQCLISTRIAKCFPDGSPIPRGVALAYLLDEYELNNDETNYFIFSDKGLRTLFGRTYWDICNYHSTASNMPSDPVRTDRDERIFCLLRSRYDRLATVTLLEGWHAPEGSGWRWTSRVFEARVRWGGKSLPRLLTLNIFLPEPLIAFARQQGVPLTLSAELNGRPLALERYLSPGAQAFTRALPASSCRAPDLVFRFSLNCALPPDAGDERERGLIVTSLSVA